MNQSPNKTETPNFEASLTSFKYYDDIEKIPRAVFRKIRGIMELQRINLDDACQQIARVILEDQKERGVCMRNSQSPQDTLQELRDRVTQRLLDARPSQASSPFAAAESLSNDEIVKALRKWR